jgi:hypothetical protein
MRDPGWLSPNHALWLPKRKNVKPNIKHLLVIRIIPEEVIKRVSRERAT